MVKEVTGGPGPDSGDLVPFDETDPGDLGGHSEKPVTTVDNIVSLGSSPSPITGPDVTMGSIADGVYRGPKR